RASTRSSPSSPARSFAPATTADRASAYNGPMSDAQTAAAEQRPRDASVGATGARGKLTVFFGAAPGVGKTYAMLEIARSERDLRRDVVVGVVETHGRYDTGALLLGLELLPRKRVVHDGEANEELDLDAALAR